MDAADEATRIIMVCLWRLGGPHHAGDVAGSLFIGLVAVTDSLAWTFVAIAGALTAMVIFIAGVASR